MPRQPKKGPLRIGEVFLGEYQVLEAIGRGGYGCVYRAREEFTGREVALKIITARDGSRESRETFERGRQEAKVLCDLEHPHVVNVFRAGQTQEGHIYIVMELLRGQSLAQRLRQGPLEVEQGLEVLESLCSALELVHSKGIAHRDIKPGNIIIREDGVAKLVDFGIAKVAGGGGAQTAPNQVPGTALYIAPEQLYSVISKGPRPAFELGDIYALGLVAFQMFQGKHPFQLLDPNANFANPEIVWKYHVETPVPRLDDVIDGFPSAAALLVATAVAKDPDDRIRSMSEFGKKAKLARNEFPGWHKSAKYRPFGNDDTEAVSSNADQKRESVTPPETAPVVRKGTKKQFPEEPTRFADVEIPQATIERRPSSSPRLSPRPSTLDRNAKTLAGEVVDPPTPQAASRTVTLPGMAKPRKRSPKALWVIVAGAVCGVPIAFMATPLLQKVMVGDSKPKLAPGEFVIEAVENQPVRPSKVPSPVAPAAPARAPVIAEHEPEAQERHQEQAPTTAPKPAPQAPALPPKPQPLSAPAVVPSPAPKKVAPVSKRAPKPVRKSSDVWLD